MAYSGWQDAPPDDLGDLDEKARRIYAEEHPPYDPRLAHPPATSTAGYAKP